MVGEIIQTNIQLTHQEPVIVGPDGSVHRLPENPVAKDLQGPEQTYVSGQMRLPDDLAIERHVAQFWDPRHHLEEPTPQHNTETSEPRDSQLSSDAKVDKLKQTMSAIEEATTIRGVRRAAEAAYTAGAQGKPLQKIIQEMVRNRKSELRKSADLGPQEMSW